MELKELKTKNQSELQAMLTQARNHLRELRFKDAAKQLKNVREIRVLRKDVARILTLLKVAPTKDKTTDKVPATK